MTGGAAKFTTVGAGASSITNLYSGVDFYTGSTSEAQGGLGIYNATDGIGYVLFGDGTGAAAYRGQIGYYHATDTMAFGVAGNARVVDIGATEIVMNQSSTDTDFRVESNGNANMLFVDGGANRVGIANSAPRTVLDVYGAEMPASGDAASVEDMLTLYRNGSASVWSGGATLAVGRYSTGSSAPKSRLDFKLKNAAGSNTALPETTVMSLQSQGAVGIGTTVPAERIHGHNGSGNDGTYLRLSGGGSLNETYGGWMRGYGVSGSGGYLELGVVDAGTKKTAMQVTAQGNDLKFYTAGVERLHFESNGNATFNDSGVNADFRVESDTNANALFVDAGTSRVGINKAAPDRALDVHSGTASDITTFANDSGGYTFGKTANLGSLDLAADASFRIRHGSTESVRFGPSATIFNEGSADVDFRVESNNEASMFVVNGGTDQVIITNSVDDGDSPNYKDSLVLHNSADGGSRILFSNGVAAELASIQGGIQGVGSGTDDGTLVFRTAKDATASEK